MDPGKKDFKSALSVKEGIEQPPQLNEQAVSRLKGHGRRKPGIQEYLEGIMRGDRAMLGQAITLVESTLQNHRQLAQELITACLPRSGNSVRIGITGVPGVGKSTFIEALGKHLTASGHKVAVLAIDPSSQRSKGSILGDKTRMELLAADNNAFIRPSPSAGSLGGVARKTNETLILCEAAGYDVIIVETVGVGQSETAVHNMVDFFLLLMLPGAGDELQGIKRGIMEMADALFINKADGEQSDLATRAKAQYQNALHLFPLPPGGWSPVVETCSAQEGRGIARAWEVILEYRAHSEANGHFQGRRREQAVERMHYAIEESLRYEVFHAPAVMKLLPSLNKALSENRITPYIAAQEILRTYHDSLRNP